MRHSVKIKKLFGNVVIDSDIAGWSSQVARRAHNPKVARSNLAPATKWRCSLVG